MVAEPFDISLRDEPNRSDSSGDGANPPQLVTAPQADLDHGLANREIPKGQGKII